jgi:hypothetical protein
MKPYCGCKQVPRGKKRGTETECAKISQVRYWGIEKVSKDGLVGQDQDRKNKIRKKQLNTRIIKGRVRAKKLNDKKELLDNKISKLRGQLSHEKGRKEQRPGAIKKVSRELAVLEKERKEVFDKLVKIVEDTKKFIEEDSKLK